MAAGLLLLFWMLAHALGLWSMAAFDQFDRQLYDARLQSRSVNTPHPEVVVVDIDERSLAALGRWPWPRDRMAALLDALFDRYSVRCVTWDMVFSEPDPGRDDALVRALRDRPVVLGYYLTSDRGGERQGQLPRPVIAREWPGPQISATRWDGYGANRSDFVQVAPRGGFFNAITDADGLVRSLPVLAEFDGVYYESLALATVRCARDVPVVLPVWSDSGPGVAPRLAGLSLPVAGQEPITVDLDRRAVAWVPYRGPGGPQAGSFRYVSAVDVLNGHVDPDTLRAQIVLVGTTAPGLFDLRSTPMGPTFPGVEVQASMIAGILDGRSLLTPEDADALLFAQMLALGLLLAVVLPLIQATAGVLLAVGLGVAAAALNQWFFERHGWVVPLASLEILVTTLLLMNIGCAYLSESRSRRRLATLFGHYVPRELVREMVRDPERYSMQAQSRHLTVMFCDMRGFTTLSETLSPHDLQRLLNTLFSRLSRRIHQQHGTIDKYMGDCVMAFWGAPVASERHAAQAVQAALDMSAELDLINADLRCQGRPTVSAGIGLSTGDMMVGDMGSDIRRSYTVMGDAVNLGARLEGLCKDYGVDIIASEATQAAAPEFLWMELDRVRVRGRQRRETLFTPLCTLAQARREDLARVERWYHFLGQWRRHEWLAAETTLRQLVRDQPAYILYRLYALRLVGVRSQPASPTLGHETPADVPTGLPHQSRSREVHTGSASVTMAPRAADRP